MSPTVSEVAGLQTSKYFNVAGIAILIFDYSITIEDEVRWVWGRNWDATRFVFTVSRYLPFVGMGMSAYTALRPSSQPCSPGLEENIIHILGIIASESLLILRTYAFWQGDKRVLFGLAIYACLSIGAATTFNIMPKQLLPNSLDPFSDCQLIGSRNSTLVQLVLLVFEMVVFFLMAYKRYKAYREVKIPIAQTIYRDGIFYIFCIALITFINVIIDGILPMQFSDLLDIPQIAIHSVLASRILFNLRKSSDHIRRGGVTDSIVVSDIAYGMAPSGTHGFDGSDSFGPRSEP